MGAKGDDGERRTGRNQHYNTDIHVSSRESVLEIEKQDQQVHSFCVFPETQR